MIRGDVRGSGDPALVFVHGWSCDRGYWAGQVEYFARRQTVVTVDLAGHGDSDSDRADWTLAAFAEDVVAVVGQLAAARMVLVGHSLGGDVATKAAVLLPGRVDGVVWADTYRSLPADVAEAEQERFVQRVTADPGVEVRAFVRAFFPPSSRPDLVERIVEDMASAPKDVLLATLRVGLGAWPEVRESLARLRVPVFAVNPGYRHTDAASLAAYGVQVRVLPEVGHFLMVEDPQGFNDLLAAVLSDLSAS
jgi:pimeloyl-ACP methyl ester carboxylesterase